MSQTPNSSCCWFSFCLPTLPIIMSALLTLPIPLLHLTHSLQPVPNKRICVDVTQHLTFDVAVLILGYGLPVLLVSILLLGLILRRCLNCGGRCCNSWCKEEAVFAQFFILTAAAQIPSFIGVVEDLADKLDLQSLTVSLQFKLFIQLFCTQ